MKSQLTTWCFLGAVAYVLLSAFHGCVDAKLEAERRPTPTIRKPAEPVEVQAPRPTAPSVPVAPVQIGQGAAESLVMGQMAQMAQALADGADQAGLPVASMHLPPLMAEAGSSGSLASPLAERMAAVFEEEGASSPLSMHMPPLFDDMAGMAADVADFAEAEVAEEAPDARAAHDPENPDIVALSAQLERQRQTIAELKQEIGVLWAAKEDLLDEVDRVQEQVADQAGEQVTQPLVADPAEDEAAGERDRQDDGGITAAVQEEDCGCDETPVVAPPASEAAPVE